VHVPSYERAAALTLASASRKRREAQRDSAVHKWGARLHAGLESRAGPGALGFVLLFFLVN
jgi:hypothetical protein